MHRAYFVYILAGRTRVLYVGVTNNIVRRVVEHRNGIGSRFTRRYGVHQLVYMESTPDVVAAIRREKQIKAWGRSKKVALIESVNPGWRDLMMGVIESDPSLRSG